MRRYLAPSRTLIRGAIPAGGPRGASKDATLPVQRPTADACFEARLRLAPQREATCRCLTAIPRSTAAPPRRARTDRAAPAAPARARSSSRGSRSTVRRASSRAAARRSPSMLEAGEAEAGQAGLAGAEHLALAAQAQILLGDAEAVLGLAHHLEARLAPSARAGPCRAGGRSRRARRGRCGRAAGGAGRGRSARRARSPSRSPPARRRRPRSPSSRRGSWSRPRRSAPSRRPLARRRACRARGRRRRRTPPAARR